ncbi:hypothetical protein [Gymnodinialimonas sp.]
MTRLISALTLSLALATQAHAFGPINSGPVSADSIPALHTLAEAQPAQDPGQPQFTDVPSYETVVSVTQIDLLITTAPEPCNPGATGFANTGDCFDAVLPGGEVRRFHVRGGFGSRHVIQGYTYEGRGVITVEHVESVNNVTCMPSGPGGCRFDRYALIED